MTSIPPTAGQTVPQPQLWIARDDDGACNIYTERPEYFKTSWIAPNTAQRHLVGLLFTRDCKSWPETFLPSGKMGLKRLVLLDPDAPAEICEHAESAGSVAGSVVGGGCFDYSGCRGERIIGQRYAGEEISDPEPRARD